MSIEAYQSKSTMLVIAEKLGQPVIANDNETVVVLSGLETGHARRIDLIFRQSVGGGIAAVKVRAYTAGRQWYYEYQVHGGIAATTYGFTVVDPYSNQTSTHVIGDTIDVVVDNSENNNTIQVWAIARS